MYDALDSFIKLETWPSGRACDRLVYFEALDRIIHNPGFNADALGKYLRSQRPGPQFATAIDRCVSDASAVRDYLETIGEVAL